MGGGFGIKYTGVCKEQMVMNLPEELNLELGWLRYKKDLKDMEFCDHPFEAEIIDANLTDWIGNVKERLATYAPSRCEIVNIPKKGFHLRPGAILRVEDATMYQALLLTDIDKIRDGLCWSAQKERFSNILRSDQTGSEWFVSEYKGWTRFREESLAILESEYKWVVFADISGFFENISIKRLLSDMNTLGVGEETRGALCCCLERWAEPRARGIPQGSRCSFILGEVYLNSIDKRLRNKGMKFCRYVDDIRIFCRSKQGAIAALHVLTELLREKELNLQTAKSFIKEGDEAREEIDSVTCIIAEAEQQLKEELSEVLEYDTGYAMPWRIEKSLATSDREVIELGAIRQAFDTYVAKKGASFDKTLFHYCINRLGAAKDNDAVTFCIDMVLDRPEEFAYMLAYFSKIRDERVSIAENLIDIFREDESVMDRHFFLLLRWVFSEAIISEKILELCRELGFQASSDIYTRQYAWAILGTNGDLADLDAIEAEYGTVDRDSSKETIICSIKTMVTDRRNAVYARAKGDGFLVRCAIKRSKES